MKAMILGQLWVKGCGERCPCWAATIRPSGKRRKHLDCLRNRFDQWSADKDCMIWLSQLGPLFQNRDIDVRSQSCPPVVQMHCGHSDIHQIQARVVTLSILREKNRPGTCAPDRPVLTELAQRFHQAVGDRQLSDRR